MSGQGCQPDCPYCAGEMCARIDGMGCHHDTSERHGYYVINDMPICSSSDRVHELDASCWCHPQASVARDGNTHLRHVNEAVLP